MLFSVTRFEISRTPYFHSTESNLDFGYIINLEILLTNLRYNNLLTDAWKSY